jgi:TonB family protein
VLLIDLEAVSERDAPGAAAERPPVAAGGGAKSAVSGSARQRRDSARSSASSQSEASSSPVAPAPPSEPEHEREHVAPPTQPDELRQPEPAVAVVPGREAAQDVIVRNEAPGESRASSGGATGDRVASGTGQGGGGRATPGAGTTGQGPGGAGGAGVAPSGPAGGAPGGEYGGYLASVRRRILGALRYPPPARSRGLTGTVQLEIFIKPDGAISTVSVTSSSSHPLLDDAALEAVRSLAPQPFPKGLLPRPLRVRLPVVFDLQ